MHVHVNARFEANKMILLHIRVGKLKPISEVHAEIHTITSQF